MLNPRRIFNQFTQRVANGVNAAADVLVEDIRAQVPVDSGRLRASYQVRRPAQPGNLRVEIGPPPEYGEKYYPFTQNFGRRQAQRPARARFFGGPDPVYENRRAALVRKQVSIELRDWIRGK